MHPTLEKLLALQERDQRLTALRRELQQVPSEKDKFQKQHSAVEARLEQVRARARSLEVERKSLENEVAAKEAQIARYKSQQMQTRKNEEYSALAHEIEAAQKLVRSLEDQELTLMEEAETLTPVLAQAEDEVRRSREHLAQALAALDVKAHNLQAQIESLENSRPALLVGLEETTLEIYTRLFRAKNGQAIVPLVEGICSGCHMKVPSQTSVSVRQAQSLVFCPLCGRLLFDAAA